MQLSPPLFTASGSTYRRRPYTPQADDEEDADWEDASLPITPIVERRGSSSFDNPVKHEDEGTWNESVKSEDEGAPLRELDPEGNVDDRQCRICFGGADDEPVLGRLISPCLCSGSMRVSLAYPS